MDENILFFIIMGIVGVAIFFYGGGGCGI